ncbi:MULTISPECIES: phage minor tail protein L [unclassified Massilia]|uniref:phage minor tail protein L n=1 Tax=unclassified Massilia TaxID=2609279 RepID=UPI001785435F|nr:MULTISPECIES: phage minor tail protein L [unclassified Massilia]MBD8531580.1 phage minor tail protein L [Massilia sp. CFBP 13647]MBD8673624.1 phage minor tail protein L [Massilia sp. CFBP 13721]
MITADIQGLEPGARVALYELDASAIAGGGLLRFHGYQQAGTIRWQGNDYTPWPIEAEGFAKTSEGQQPTPRLSVGNVDGSISALCITLDDLVGAKLTRHVTLGQYLDAANFANGNPTADPDQEFPLEVWFIEQKTSETNEVVEFELKSALDFQEVMLPRRQIIANLCAWQYRGAHCGYVGAAKFNVNDQAVTDPALDVCSKRLSSCKVRFGARSVLNFGGFPAAALIQS